MKERSAGVEGRERQSGSIYEGKRPFKVEEERLLPVAVSKSEHESLC